MINKDSMRKIVLVLVLVMVVSFAGGAVVMFATGGIMKNGVVSQKLDQERILALEGINDLRVESSSTRVNIIPSTSAELRAHLNGEFSSTREDYYPELSVTETGSRVTIKLQWPSGGVIGYYSSDIKLDIYLPAAYNKNLELSTSSANVEASGFNLQNFSASLVSGRVKLEDISAKEFSVSTSSGNGNLKNITSQELQYKSVSGDLTAEQMNTTTLTIDTSSGHYALKDVESSSTDIRSVSGNITGTAFASEKTEVQSSSGRISLQGRLGDVTAVAVSGSITLAYNDFANSVMVSTSLGDVRLELPAAAEFDLEYKTSSGKWSNDFPCSYSKLEKNTIVGKTAVGGNLIKVSTVSGDFSVTRK